MFLTTQTTDIITILTTEGTITLNFEQSWSLLEFLYNMRDELYPGQQVRYLPGEV